MNYGDIIKRSWHITWRYKALWVLGIFAGVSGCQASGGSSYRTSSSDFPALQGRGVSPGTFRGFLETISPYAPLIIAATLVLILLALVFAVLSVAARGGLVTGANSAEEGRRATLTELWGAGFGRFWSLVGLDILLSLPIFVVGMAMLVGVMAPLLGTIMGGGEPSAAIAAPICGSLAIGLPLLLVLSFVLGIMHLLALRYVMLGGQGAIEAARNGWHFFRARFKDTFLMWLINTGLNLAASVALAIPMIVIGIAVVIPMVAAGIGEQWGLLAGVILLAILLFWVVAALYNGIWGTFTSSLWTLFFRDVTGMSASAVEMSPVPAAPVASEPWSAPPPPAVPEGPPVAFPAEPPAPPADA